MNAPGFVPLAMEPVGDDAMEARAAAFEATMKRRRTVRDFSPEPVPRAVIESAIRTAGGAPSGANQQPWSFVAIDDPAIKARIRRRPRRRSGRSTTGARARNGSKR